ncbi:MAG TPA: hypothetical protein VFT52_08810, partial [Luteimonas sp.]|nr:hypothetical protein [Luteimonas sp.]
MSSIRALQVAFLAVTLAACATQAPRPAPPPAEPSLSPAQSQLLSTISADEMRGHLSFLASDALEGRGTPSRGLDIAAEYIA